jgi:UDP-N-acetyl-D-glucosamine dehydrogenase
MQYSARFIELADAINSSMPGYVVDRVIDVLNENGKPVRGSRILIYGVAYKRNVSDVRESPALEILHQLGTRGAELAYMDPLVPEVSLHGAALRSTDPERGFSEFDVVVIVTDHDTLDRDRVLREAALVIDTRDALAGSTRPGVYRL